MVDMRLTMTCMILKVNLGVGEIVFIRFSIITLQWGYKFDEFALFEFCFSQATHPILGI